MKYLKLFESFDIDENDIDEDAEYLKNLSFYLKDEDEWSVNVYTNTEKYNGNEYSYKVILEPLDVFDYDLDNLDKLVGGKINDTLIQYLESIVKYMKSEEHSKNYDYKIILTSDDPQDHHEINLENLEEFKKWTQRELKHQRSDILTYGFKGDLIIIEFYEKNI